MSLEIHGNYFPKNCKYTIVFLQFFRKHKEGKSLPSMENKRDIPEKNKTVEL